MKAAVYLGYGPPEVVQIKEVNKPVPKDNEVLVKVEAAAVNALDWRFMRGEPFAIRLIFGIMKPGVLPGRDVAGVVEAVGSKVTQFKPGDEVFGACKGAFAEYACTKESSLAVKPSNVTFEQAGAIGVAALTALQALRDHGGIKSGQTVLIDGAGGGVGTFAVQIAKSYGSEVTAVCGTANQNLMRTIGADYVVDYNKEDFTKGNKHYDLVVAANAYHSLSEYRRVLNPGGTLVVSSGNGALGFQLMLTGKWISMFGKQKLTNMLARIKKDDLHFIGELMAAGKVKSIIDRCYPLDRVAEAIGYVEQGHTAGKVVILLTRGAPFPFKVSDGNLA